MTGMLPDQLRETVAPYLSVADFQSKWTAYRRQPRGDYYALTYPCILSFFRHHGALSSALSLKVALVYSWNQRICQVKEVRFRQAASQLGSLESLRKQVAATSLLAVDTDTVIREFWKPLQKATSSSTGVSVTKFLHFTFPHIFPIIDLQASEKLGRTGSGLKPEWYCSFVSEWKKLYRHHQQCFDRISTDFCMPVARVVDVMIFTPRKAPGKRAP